MAALSSKAVQAALLARLMAKVPAGTVKTWSRKYLSFDQMGGGLQPAVLVLAEGQTSAKSDSPGLPEKIIVRTLVLVYVREKLNAPEDTLLDLVDQIRAALVTGAGDNPLLPGYAFDFYNSTLGGLVRHVWIPEIQFDQGAEGQQAVAQITVDLETYPTGA